MWESGVDASSSPTPSAMFSAAPLRRTLLSRSARLPLHVLSGAAARLSTAARPSITFEQALTSSHMVIETLQSPEVLQQLAQARGSEGVLAKWELANRTLIHSTLSVMPQVGFTQDGRGLQNYTDALAEQMRNAGDVERKTLKDLVHKKWEVLLDNVFGCKPAPPMPLLAARELAIDLVDAMQDEKLLKEMDAARTGLMSHMTEQERQGMVARALVSAQIEVCSKHGFEGEGGFAQAQVCLMDHAADAVVTSSVAAATTNLYARAGIDLHAALRQATG